MIKQLTVRDAFERASRHGNSRGLGGFALKALPVGHNLNVDSPLVLLIGDNGTGKSTFLDKLSMQFVGWGMDHWYMDVKCNKYGEPNQVIKCDLDEGYDPLSDEMTLSHGEYTFRQVPKLLAEARKYPKKDILYFDEPENGVSLRNKGKLVRMISDYAFKEKRQIFVATHEPEFLKVPDARVINLDAHPATSCLASEFDLRKYMAGN